MTFNPTHLVILVIVLIIVVAVVRGRRASDRDER